MATRSRKGKCILLMQSQTVNRSQEKEQLRAEHLLRAKRVDFDFVDATQRENHTLRDAMFAISEENTFPQIFIRYGPTLYFVGLWDRLEALNEADSLPPALLRQIQCQDPDYLTFTEIFDCVGVIGSDVPQRLSLTSLHFDDTGEQVHEPYEQVEEY